MMWNHSTSLMIIKAEHITMTVWRTVLHHMLCNLIYSFCMSSIRNELSEEKLGSISFSIPLRLYPCCSLLLSRPLSRADLGAVSKSSTDCCYRNGPYRGLDDSSFELGTFLKMVPLYMLLRVVKLSNSSLSDWVITAIYLSCIYMVSLFYL